MATVVADMSMSPRPVPDRRGRPYFSGLEAAPVKLVQREVVEGQGVTHLYYEVER